MKGHDPVFGSIIPQGQRIRDSPLALKWTNDGSHENGFWNVGWPMPHSNLASDLSYRYLLKPAAILQVSACEE